MESMWEEMKRDKSFWMVHLLEWIYHRLGQALLEQTRIELQSMLIMNRYLLKNRRKSKEIWSESYWFICLASLVIMIEWVRHRESRTPTFGRRRFLKLATWKDYCNIIIDNHRSSIPASFKVSSTLGLTILWGFVSQILTDRFRWRFSFANHRTSSTFAAVLE